MSQNRGRGRVVPRSSQQQQQQLAFDKQQLSLPSSLHGNSKTFRTSAQSLVPAAASSDSNAQWCVADCVLANSRPVQQLAPCKLSTGHGRQLLNSGQPLLLKQLQLPRCSIKQQQAQDSPPNAAPVTQPADPAPMQLSVLCSPASSNRFITADASKNMPGSYYHVRKPETNTLQMTFRAWLACWQSWTQTHNRLLLQAHVCNWELHGSPAMLRLWPNKAVYPHLTQLLEVPQHPASNTAAQPAQQESTSSNSSSSGGGTSSTQHAQGLPAATEHLLDWALLQQLLQSGQWASTGSLQLLAGGSDALLPARYETHDRLLNQVSGRMQVVLLPPESAFKGLYPHPVHHPYDRYSAVDWEDPELEHWPAAGQVHGLVCELAPGDCLLVPAYWFLHSQLLQPACVSLEVQLTAQPARLSSALALLLQLSRMMELWFGAEAGPANVRKWFKALSAGREWDLLEPQLLTPKGYRLLHCCHMALEQLQQVMALQPQSHSPLGSASGGAARHASKQGVMGGSQHLVVGDGGLEAAARMAVGLMCEGRLVPTTWLNEGISDPLYLQHPPEYHLIEEDEEASRYSSLFKHRLIANRPDWRDHATQLQLAPPGSGRTLVQAVQAAGQHVQALPPSA